jgi:hypothetical protein
VFTNSTSYNDDEVIQVTEDGDGIINIAFGVVNAGATTDSSSALVIDDVQVTIA